MNQFPTVVLDEYCDGLLDRVQQFAPTFLFKRIAGYLSDPGVAADELHRLLLSRSYVGPFVIVSPSFGAYTALLYASKYRDSVAGLILVDPSHPRQGPVALEVLPPEKEIVSPSVAKFRSSFAGFGPTWDEGCRLVSSIESLWDIPLVVLAAGRPEAPSDLPVGTYDRLVKDRHLLLEDYAKLSSRGEVRIIPDVGHGITVDAPEVVCRAISEMITNIRSKRPNLESSAATHSSTARNALDLT